MKKLLLIMITLAITFSGNLQTASAAVSSDYFINNKIYNNLISNRDFTDVGSMSEAAIQQFLVNNGSYLKDFSEAGRSAARIIYDAAHGKKFTQSPYDTWLGDTLNGVTLNESTGTVSPKVLLVMLQKEQSLITLGSRNENRLDIAMGYGCPDSSSCSSHYFGFTNQVEWAAWQLRYNAERAQGKGLDFQVGQTMNNVDGKYAVTFTNAATASIYRYTPHVFDSAFNFYNLYTGWFTITADSDANDTVNFTLKTYNSNQKVSGLKRTDSRAVLHGSSTVLGEIGSKDWKLELSGLAFGTNSYTIDYTDSAGKVLAQKSITIVIHKPGDVNGDGGTDLQDLSIFAAYWDQINPEEPLANLTGEVGHKINVQDLSILAGYWGS
ncbi:MAG: hypothetical protein WC107_00435 [Patescibacteria group bacterium]